MGFFAEARSLDFRHLIRRAKGSYRLFLSSSIAACISASFIASNRFFISDLETTLRGGLRGGAAPRRDDLAIGPKPNGTTAERHGKYIGFAWLKQAWRGQPTSRSSPRIRLP